MGLMSSNKTEIILISKVQTSKGYSRILANFKKTQDIGLIKLQKNISTTQNSSF